jgi:integrase
MSVSSRLGPAEVLTVQEVRAVLDACSKKARARRYPTAERNYALVMLLWRTGLRCAEALDLESSDLRLRQAPATVRVRDGKGGVQRTVGVHPELVLALEDWLRLRPAGRWVFCTLQGARLSERYVRAMVARKGARAGLARCHPHAFRATLAVELAAEGVPMPVIRDVLGHSSVAVTDAYLRRVSPALAIAATAGRAEVLASRWALAHELVGAH